MSKPIPKDIGEHVAVSKSSPTGLIWIHPGKRRKLGEPAGSAVTNNPNKFRLNFRNKSYLTHRIMYFLETGVDPGQLDIDHKNHGGPLDTLRVATRSQNNANKKRSNTSTARFKGVYKEKRSKKWLAKISVNNKCVYLGSYSTQVEAAWVYNQAAVEHFGAFARLNVLLVKTQ
jgi:hypothetical protein